MGQSFWEYFEVKELNKFVQFQGKNLTQENTQRRETMNDLNCLYQLYVTNIYQWAGSIELKLQFATLYHMDSSCP